MSRATPAAAPGWVDHLRHGGTTTWPAWRDAHPPSAPRSPQPGGLTVAATGGHSAVDYRGGVPGAQQLELLRRLNVAGSPTADLVGRVLGAGTTGRGLPDLALDPGPSATDGSRAEAFGAAPVDPTRLPAGEVLRVAAGLLAEEVAATPPPPVQPPAWGFLLRRRYRVVGDPRLADPVREELARRGGTIGGRDSRVLVLGAGAEQMLADAWVSRFLDQGAPTWSEWLAEWADRDAAPARVDLVTAARAWGDREGVRRVHVVLDMAALPRLVASRTLPPPPDPVPAHAAELARRVAAVLGVLVEPRRRELLVGRLLLPRLTTAAREVDPHAAPPGVPARLRPWLDRTAARLHAGVLAAGYPVHGEPDRLLDVNDGVAPTEAGALDVAVAALLHRSGSQGERDRA